MIHELTQGSDAWIEFRSAHFGASEAAAMLGLSTKTKRNELLYMKFTCTAKEFSEWVQSNILDHGHFVEAMARPITEREIGDDLYPVTCSRGSLSASCDGLTMCESHGWEHKQWNEELAASVAAGVLPEEHYPQVMQELLVTGAEDWLFTVSDGTEERRVSMKILPDAAWFDRIERGWAQFAEDLANYQHVEILPAAVAAPVQDLPALSIRVDGALTLNHNLVLFGDKLTKFIADINKAPDDDQGFADAEQAVKVMKRAEEALGAAEASALGQISTVDDMVKTVASYKELARKTRLMLEKMVTSRKETIRVEIQQAGKDKATAHIAALNVRLGKPYMPAVPVDFAGVMKNKRTIASLRDAVDTELARFKIEANAIADKIQLNLTAMNELGADHMFLFADAAQIILKAPDDFSALVKLRISDHKAKEAQKAADLRAEIQKEEQSKAEAAAQAQVAAATPTPAPAAEAAPASSTFRNIPVASSVGYAKPATPPSLRLGQINERIAPLSISVEGLRTLGFEPAARDKAAQLYHEHQFPSICAALIRHIGSIQTKQAA